ncbi:hypothetical protein TM1040_2651 [Ruegeria sp. TM1040]|uniref:hypothetical protein n=1 Tax=Ruegeria sp. (strain TM1040) TaxID=292414 RepID=UPI000046317C|nr:hypothetical protein [Ruegeria sp. TM1040]ABF65383.1 hypothetical protein TM1040_2651 [Ruegeria sp. TM1040]
MTRLASSTRNLHRKFIAAVIATALVITGFSAAPARADSDDIAKFIAGAAILGIIGAAINDHKKDRHRPPHVDPTPAPKPLPPRVRRYDLPAQCLTSIRVHGKERNLLGMHCLRRNYTHVNTLPNRCYREFDNRTQSRRGYRPACLRQYGYRLVRL